MHKKLLLSLYPKANQTACLMLKNEMATYRINHLWQYPKFVAKLEGICSGIGRGLYFKECIDLFDKKKNHWIMLLSFSSLDANLVLWLNSREQRHQKPKFSWFGTVATFKSALALLTGTLR
jgi:hypothetical protein